MKHRLLIVSAFLICLFLVAACATSPTGRNQLQLFSSGELARMGQVSYRKMAQEIPEEKNQAVNRYVNCVVDAVTASLPGSAGRTEWKVTVFDKDDEVNAFALPGGYIGIYTGLLKVAENQDQLAAVVGHEIAHVTAKHPNARLSTQYTTQAGLQLINAFIGGQAGGGSKEIMALLGVGSQVGILLPFSRSQESEADILGLDYMARAGFDPRESIDLWQNMARSGGGKPPEFLSTHPSEHSRIQTLQNRMPEAMELYRQSRQQNRIPQCRRPAGL
ncbi:MAG: M48 family metallopeptidase [Desulfohalobiaceae bacterium]|nr:M48 family metallopeptidase [Desulfohalobiaceae bacterium]